MVCKIELDSRSIGSTAPSGHSAICDHRIMLHPPTAAVAAREAPKMKNYFCSIAVLFLKNKCCKKYPISEIGSFLKAFLNTNIYNISSE